MSEYTLGISCFYHDSAAALIKDGEIIYAAQEEGFTRIEHDFGFPKNAINFCLKSQNIKLTDQKSIFYYQKPLLTFERLLETYLEWINSRIILGIVFILQPIAIIMKFFGYDPLRLNKTNKYNYRKEKSYQKMNLKRIF